MEVQEAIKLLHGQPALLGAGLHLDGFWGETSRVAYPRREDCPGHDRLPEPVPLGLSSSEVTLGALLERAEAELGVGAVLDLSRDVIVRLDCPACAHVSPAGAVGKVLGAVRESEARCPGCGAHRVVEIAASVSRDGQVDLAATPAALGLPPFDIVVARQGADAQRQRAWLLDGDAPSVLGPLAPSLSLSSPGAA
jgi:hypothetical protein